MQAKKLCRRRGVLSRVKEERHKSQELKRFFLYCEACNNC